MPAIPVFDYIPHLALTESDEQLLADAERDSIGALASVTIVCKRPGNRIHTDWETTAMGTIAIEPGRLSAEVNLQPRADAVAKAIEAALGEGVEFRVTQVQSMEKVIADARAKAASAVASEPEPNPLAELPEVKQKLAEVMAAHWERWVDQPLPALSGRTPIQAVQDPDGRESVESLLVQAERYGRRMSPPTDEAIFRRVRERLRLPVRN